MNVLFIYGLHKVKDCAAHHASVLSLGRGPTLMRRTIE